MMRHLVLGLLRHGGARHGYALMKEYRDGSGRTVSVGNLYRELQHLRESGLVRPAAADTEDVRRRPYQITAAGAATFDAWLRRPCRDAAEGAADTEHALRAFLVLRLGSELAPRVLREWRDELRAGSRALARVQDRVRRAEREGAAGPPSTLALWLRRRMKHLETDLEFVAYVESILAGESPAGGRAMETAAHDDE